MSSKSCDPTGVTGFPLNVSASASPLLSKTNDKLQDLIVPTEFTVSWGQFLSDVSLIINKTSGTTAVPAVCQISGFSDLASQTTMVYGNARYSCSGVLSIVQNQHKHFNLNMGKQALYEVILAFQIQDKSSNPSSPDIILLTRSIVFTTADDPAAVNVPVFWTKVNKMMESPTENPQTNLDLATMFGYNSNTLMPMISYQSCLPVKILNGSSASSFSGSLTMRVNVIINPIYVVATDTGLGRCSVVDKYTLITNSGLINIFANSRAEDIMQFNTEFSNSGPIFPNSSETYLTLTKSSYAITSMDDIAQKIEIVVPDPLLGRPLAEIASATILPASVTSSQVTNTKFKCYSIDPKKDIVDGQIMIDPTTGLPLENTLEQESLARTGGIAIPSLPSSGISPGDIQEAIVITMIVIISTVLFIYAGYIIYNFIYNMDIPVSTIIYHCLGFVCILIMLVLFSVYVKKPK
jgi:hypothetical protein